MKALAARFGGIGFVSVLMSGIDCYQVLKYIAHTYVLTTRYIKYIAHGRKRWTADEIAKLEASGDR